MANMGASGNDDNPSLTLPPSENVGSDGTVAVAGGNYSDSFAQSNPGSMYIGISDNSGLLYAWYPGANGSIAPAGFGSNDITFSGSYADVQAIINSLTYVATVNNGGDNVHYDIWNQAGVETTGDVPVTIQPVAASDTWLGTVSADWNTGANWSTGAPPTSGDSVAIPSGTPFDASLSSATLGGETITLVGGVSQAPTVNFSNLTLASTLLGTGTIDIGGTLTITATGTMELQNSSDLASAGPATIINDGTIISASGDHLFFNNGGTADGSGTLINNGIIDANGGEIAVQLNANDVQPEMLRNAGTIAIANGGNIWMNGTIAGGDIAFSGPGALTLQQGMAFTSGATVTGFGQGDQIDLFSTAAGKDGTLSFANGTLDVSVSGTIAQAIPLAGSYTLGNFEFETVAGDSNSSVIAYAPNDGPSGVTSPNIVAPASDTATQGTTLALNDVSIDAPGTTQAGVTIVAQSGTLFMNGATGSGTSQIGVGMTSISQLNTDLASLTYVPTPGATDDTVSITTLPPAPVYTTRSIPISIDSNNASPGLHEPTNETVAADGTVTVSGSYVDSFAQGNPGDLYLGISDNTGTLYATDAAGNPMAGSGTNSISIGTDYNDLNAALASLRYVAAPGAGSDGIYVDIWNQAGVQTTDTVPVTVTAGTGGTTETWTGAVSGDWNTAGNWSGAVVPTSGDTAIIASSSAYYPTLNNAILNNETIIVDEEAQQPGNTPDLNGVTLGAGSLLEIQNPNGDSQNIATINLGGTVTVDAGATIVSNDSASGGAGAAGAGAVLVNDGTIDNTAVLFGNGGTVFNNGLFENQAIGATTLINAGTILASNAGASIESVTQGGTVEITNGVGLTLNGTLSGTAVNFNGPGQLLFQQPNALTNGSALYNFGQGDEFALTGSAYSTNTTLAFNNDTLTVRQGGSVVQAVPFSGNYTLGNFVIEVAQGTPFVFAYAPSDGFANIAGYGPDIAAPAQAAVSQGGTLSLGNVAIQNTTTYATSLHITAASGTLFMNGATGSGTNSLIISGSNSQVNADLASLTYTPTAGSSSDLVEVAADIDFPSAVAATERLIPISVKASSGPALNEPSSEMVAADGTVAVSGSYSDSFAQGNPGSLYLGISDSNGTLYAKDASGDAVAGSGTNSISIGTDYRDLNAALASLTYVAGSAGSDSIYFDIWNQAGVQTTDTVPVTVSAGSTGGTTATWTGAVSSGWDTAGNWSGGMVPVSGDTVMIPQGTTNTASLSSATLSGDTITLGGVTAAVNFTNVTLSSGTVLDGAGTLNIGDTLTVGAGATLAPSGLMPIIGLGGTDTTLVNDGIIQSGTNTVFSDDSAVLNDGTMSADGGLLQFGTLTNDGSINLQQGEIWLGTDAGGTIAFDGSATLRLGNPMALTDGAVVAGFASGDVIAASGPVSGNGLSFNSGTLDITNGATLLQAIPMTGSLGLGNFEISTQPGLGTPPILVGYVPNGGPSNISLLTPDISAPSTGSIAADGTLGLGSVAISNTGTLGSLDITATSGTLYMNGATGSGTDNLSISGPTSVSQINADLASLQFVAGSSAGNTTVEVTAANPANTYGSPVTSRYIPVSVGAASNGPVLSEPSSETVAPSGTVAVGGSYSDSFAQHNPGELYVGISGSNGSLSATNASGQLVAGSGTNNIGVSGDFVDVNAILASLHYTAGESTGSDTIQFQVWNQAGVDTTGATSVSIGSAMTAADIAGPGAMSSDVMLPTSNSSAASMMLGDMQQQPIGMPLALQH